MLKLRRYQATDKPVIWRLHRLAIGEIGLNSRYKYPWEKDLDDIETTYLEGGDFLIGEIMGKIVAMGAFRKINNETAEIKRMRVHPDFQRRGFGRIILEELETRAKKMGYKKMVMDTSEKWIHAQNFYIKNGYKETGRKVLHKRYHTIYYEKDLK